MNAGYTVKIVGAAKRQLRRLSKDSQRRILDKIEKLSLEAKPRGYKQLQGDANLFRIRIGDYRVIYEIHESVLIVLVLRIAHRREVYR